ncbi:MAG: LCP family protein, partial [Nanoarchaeota archaeon]|nr:LCP family protein [Nanoarchaeota archaeon]
LISLIIVMPYLGISLKREITIVAETSNISTINLGHIKPILPFSTDNNRVNFLLLGIAGEGNSAPELTDTMIIINSTPRADNPVAISVPRDLLVKYPDKNFYTKINALYKYGGIDAIKSEIYEITELSTDYYLVVNLESVKKIIDQLGGIDVDVKEDIFDPKFPAPYNSFEIFSLKRGIQHLDGATALKYIRTRNQPEGDFSRIARQQQVIVALKDKITSLNFILNFPKILGIWNILQDNSYTNLGLTDIKYAWNLIKKTNLDEIKFNAIAPPLVVSSTTKLGGQEASVLIPSIGTNNYEEIKEFINKLISNQ